MLVNASFRLNQASMRHFPHSISLIRRKLASDVIITIPQVIQTYITTLHSFTGLPWWATFATSTLAVRLSLLPLVRLQIINSSKIAGNRH